MKSIDDIKTELILKMLQGPLDWRDIEKLPKDDELRSFICQFEPQYAYLYALLVDEAPHPETRTAACKNPYWAFCYALYVDKAPTEKTRIAACKDPYWAYCYALQIDKEPHPYTRTNACKNSNWAFAYAFNIDKKPSEETRIAVSKDPGLAKEYQEWEQEYNRKLEKEKKQNV